MLGMIFTEFVGAAGCLPAVFQLCRKWKRSVQLPVFCVGNSFAGRPSLLAILIAPEATSCRNRSEPDLSGSSRRGDSVETSLGRGIRF